ncbi:neurofilament medium polypeptide-like [Dorcoceras hygrometricum]|uniref:Neurofilament medium polypeptide-like n=1 Tax=Dorcoceras hygrometricum TaxID=472368 RepID=A0A2Z7CHU0_9LAMI|nr:neurofilament medium polypeptide-like [Dorcoceras hygrometricum]
MKSEEPKATEQPQLPLSPPPQDIIMKVYMHCEGCARKVRRCLKDFEGRVEDVITDCRTSKVVVKGEKADPLKVLERLQKKSHRQVVLISPIPKPPAEHPKKPEEIIEDAKSEEKKKEEPPVVTVVLAVYMHCEACAQEIKKRIQRMKGVDSAESDLKSSQVTVRGVFEPEKLVDYVWKRTGKQAVISKVEPEDKVNQEDKVKKVEEAEKETNKVENGKEKEEPNGTTAGKFPPRVESEDEEAKMDFRRNEFFQNYQVYPQRFIQDSYAAYPSPQIFSDENPNACFVM